MKNILSFILLAALWATNANAFTLRFDACGISFAWTATDNVGMMTEEGAQMRYDIGSIAEDEHCATLFSLGWALRENMTYYAYAPYNIQYSEKENRATSLPVDYSLQQQTGNDNTDHLAQHAFYMGSVKVEDAMTDATIHFRPMTAVIRLSRSFEVPVTLKQVQLSVDDHLIPLLGTMNLLEESFIPLGFAKNITLNVNNILLKAGEEAVVYLTLPSCNLKGHTLTITYTSTDGTRYEQSVEGFEIHSGSTYCIGNFAAPTTPQTYSPLTKGTKDAPIAVACNLPIAGTYVPTDIQATKADVTRADVTNDRSYDLNGRHILGNHQHLTIHNGKKILKR